MRTFDTGATRDACENKYDYEGFLSPWVLERFAEYMHKHRKQADGKLRDSDNWQKGIPRKEYMKSLFRHFMDLWQYHRCHDDRIWQEKLEDTLCAILFNTQGYLHRLLLQEEPYEYEAEKGVDVPQNETIQRDSNPSSPGLCAKTTDPPRKECQQGDYFQPESERVFSLPLRDQRVSPEETQANGLSDSESSSFRISGPYELSEILGLLFR